ncbi:predicted protein [Sclerotinia sclerotiorum 1980 UF-70]|uniref:Uncharacterized protein n=1 Tax=Sclerotinia sclerotiorum (strain ATCC 18683 / 1980 / Ss-1) TaxID=665079 RepID=A7EVA7_SCLS1|nr:predicted protein [Sclerotinia sclerotiorum 1980 UF-70]EDN93399.1 predicted protein [Sclerotinia sclerotiorum 1980 UF-70]
MLIFCRANDKAMAMDRRFPMILVGLGLMVRK